jgi:hypothetical protein
VNRIKLYLFFFNGKPVCQWNLLEQRVCSNVVVGMHQPDSRIGEHVFLAARQTIVNLDFSRDVKAEKD